MITNVIRGLAAVGALAERIEALEEAVEALESRMDTDEAKRIEWVGTVKRTLARINKAERAEDSRHPDVPNGDGAFAEAQRLGLFR